jgi:hypothetical protein
VNLAEPTLLDDALLETWLGKEFEVEKLAEELDPEL